MELKTPSNLVTFTVETGVHGKYVKYEDRQGEDCMLFTDWISSAYNTHNIVYPVAAEDCPEGYIPITFADDETIPNTNGGFLSLIREYAPSIN